MRPALLILSAFALPAPALAQACIGTPSPEGQTLAAGVFGFGEGFRDYGLAIVGNRQSPWSLGASISAQRFPEAPVIDDVRGTALEVMAAFETYRTAITQTRGPDTPVSGCITGTFGVRRVKGRASALHDLGTTARATSVELGYGLGVLVADTPENRVAVYAWPRLVVTWAEAEAGGESDTESRAEPALALGAAFHLGALLIGGEVGIAREEWAFGLRIGLTLF